MIKGFAIFCYVEYFYIKSRRSLLTGHGNLSFRRITGNERKTESDLKIYFEANF